MKFPCENCIVLGICKAKFREGHLTNQSPYISTIPLLVKCDKLGDYLSVSNGKIENSSELEGHYHTFFIYFGIKIYNSVPLRIKDETSLSE